MIHPITEEEIRTFSWFVVGCFSAWGGVVRYLMDNRLAGNNWSTASLVSQVMISGFTGFIGGFYSFEQGNSTFMTLIIACLCSSLGGSLLRWLWRRILQTQETHHDVHFQPAQRTGSEQRPSGSGPGGVPGPESESGGLHRDGRTPDPGPAAGVTGERGQPDDEQPSS
jgi:hypothetical protein